MPISCKHAGETGARRRRSSGWMLLSSEVRGYASIVPGNRCRLLVDTAKHDGPHAHGGRQRRSTQSGVGNGLANNLYICAHKTSLFRDQFIS